MTGLRSATRSRRLRIESGELFEMETVIGWGVTFDEALSVFDGPRREVDDSVYPECCGETVICISALFGSKAECKHCHAKIVDALGPMYSPILESRNSYVTVAGEKLIEAMGERHWLVMHEGDRP